MQLWWLEWLLVIWTTPGLRDLVRYKLCFYHEASSTAAIDFHRSSMGILLFQLIFKYSVTNHYKTLLFFTGIFRAFITDHTSYWKAKLKTAQFCLEECQTSELLPEYYFKPFLHVCMMNYVLPSESFGWRVRVNGHWQLSNTRMGTGSQCLCQKSMDLESLKGFLPTSFPTFVPV